VIQFLEFQIGYSSAATIARILDKREKRQGACQWPVTVGDLTAFGKKFWRAMANQLKTWRLGLD
jgi:hypothetical protein